MSEWHDTRFTKYDLRAYGLLTEEDFWGVRMDSAKDVIERAAGIKYAAIRQHGEWTAFTEIGQAAAEALAAAGLLASPELLRAAEACKEYARYWRRVGMHPQAAPICVEVDQAGRALLAKDEGPWKIERLACVYVVSGPSGSLQFTDRDDAMRYRDALNRMEREKSSEAK